MAVSTALAVIAARDLEASRSWWETLLGRAADRIPMPTDVEWAFPAGGGLQLIDDAEHAGSSSVTLVVDDVDAELIAISSRGIDVPEAQTTSGDQFRIAILRDPDANTVVIAQDLTSRADSS